jgi:hypothetical protein
MTVSLSILLVCVAIRLRAKFAAGVLAVAVIFVGGGLGFTGALADSCATQQVPPSAVQTATYTNSSDAQVGCSIGDVLTHPVAASAALHGLPGLITHEPRAYDGLAVDEPACPVADCSTYYSVVDNLSADCRYCAFDKGICGSAMAGSCCWGGAHWPAPLDPCACFSSPGDGRTVSPALATPA